MVDFIEELILGGFRAVPNGTGAFVGPGSQDCAALVLGYFRFSLREKKARRRSPEGRARRRSPGGKARRRSPEGRARRRSPGEKSETTKSRRKSETTKFHPTVGRLRRWRPVTKPFMRPILETRYRFMRPVLETRYRCCGFAWPCLVSWTVQPSGFSGMTMVVPGGAAANCFA